MKIAFDARALSHPQPGGFKTYTTNLLQALLELDSTNAYCVYLDRELPRRDFTHRRDISQRIIRSGRSPAGAVWREQVLLPLELRRSKPDIVHFPCSTAPLIGAAPLIATIHDAIEFVSAPWLPRASAGPPRRALMAAYNRLVQRRVASRASVVITVSRHAKRDLVKQLHVADAKIRVIPNAPGPQFRPEYSEGRIRALRGRYRIPEAPIVTLVSAAPRKNAAGLLRAYARLSVELRRSHPLVMVLTHPLLESRLRAQSHYLNITENVLFLPPLADEELALLYCTAALFAFPSLYEGFGLPVLEAMACGAPVLASNLSATPEVAGQAAELVDPRDESELSRALARLLSDPDRRAALAVASLERARQFTWERTARLTLDVYEEVAGLTGCSRARAA